MKILLIINFCNNNLTKVKIPNSNSSWITQSRSTPQAPGKTFWSYFQPYMLDNCFIFLQFLDHLTIIDLFHFLHFLLFYMMNRNLKI